MTTIQTLALQKLIEKSIREDADKYFNIDGQTISLSPTLGLINAESGNLRVGINGGQYITTVAINNGTISLKKQAEVIDRVAMKINYIKLFGE